MAYLQATTVNGTLKATNISVTGDNISINNGDYKLAFSAHKFIMADSEAGTDIRINIPQDASANLSVETWTFTTDSGDVTKKVLVG